MPYLMYSRKVGAGSLAPWDISSSTFLQEQNLLSLSGQQETRGMDFSSDGTRFYTCGSNPDRVHSFTLSTPFDISTISYDNKTITTTGQIDTPYGVRIKDDGTKLYIVGLGGRIREYTLSTPYEIDTASISYSSNAEGYQAFDIFFRYDGTQFYILDYFGLPGGTSIRQYTMSTAWDVSTATFDNKELDLATLSGLTTHDGMAISPNGEKLVVISDDSNQVHQYTLSTPWDITTATADGVTFGSGLSITQAVSISPDGAFAYAAGFNTDKLRQFTL